MMKKIRGSAIKSLYLFTSFFLNIFSFITHYTTEAWSPFPKLSQSVQSHPLILQTSHMNSYVKLMWSREKKKNTHKDQKPISHYLSVSTNMYRNETIIPSSVSQSISALLLATTLSLLCPSLLSPLSPSLSTHFDIPKGGASFGSLTSAYPFGTLVGLCFWPTLSDSPYHGRKFILIVAFLGTAIGLSFQGLAICNNWPLHFFLVTRVFTGCFAGSAPMIKAYLADIGRSFQKNEYSSLVVNKLLSWRDAAGTLAYILGPMLGGILFEKSSASKLKKQINNSVALRNSLSNVMFVSAIGSLLATGLIFLFVEDILMARKNKHLKKEIVPHFIPSSHFKEVTMYWPVRTGRFTNISALFMVTFLYHVSDSTLFAFLPALLETHLGMSVRTMGLALTSCACLSFTLSACSFSTSIISKYDLLGTCAIGLSLIGIGLFMISLVAGGILAENLTFVGMFLYFCGVPFYGPSANMMLLRSVDSGIQGKVMGMNGAINMVARVMAPLVVGNIYQRKNGMIAFGISVGSTLLSLFIIMYRFLLRTRNFYF